jgi:hypothetical protein
MFQKERPPNATLYMKKRACKLHENDQKIFALKINKIYVIIYIERKKEWI